MAKWRKVAKEGSRQTGTKHAHNHQPKNKRSAVPLAEIGGGGSARSRLPHASIPKHTTALATRASRVGEHLQARVDSAAAKPPNAAITVNEAPEPRFADCRTGRIGVEAEEEVEAEEVPGASFTAGTQSHGRMKFDNVPIVAALIPGYPRTLPPTYVEIRRSHSQITPNAMSATVSRSVNMIPRFLPGLLQTELAHKSGISEFRGITDSSSPMAVATSMLHVTCTFNSPAMLLDPSCVGHIHVKRQETGC